jgi:Spy/CpxP family protein refolding chaperone
MKKIMLSAVIISASVCATYAQDQKTTPQADQKTTQPQVVKEVDQKSYQAKQQDWENLLKTELKLTDEQSTKIAAINKDFSEKKDAILKDASLNDDAKKEKKEALMKEREAKFFEVLTPEQQTKYKQLLDAKMKEPQTPKQ